MFAQKNYIYISELDQKCFLMLYMRVYGIEFKSKNFRIAIYITIFLPGYLRKALFLKCEFSQHCNHHVMNIMEKNGENQVL